MSDDKFIVKGKVVDINVYSNNPEKLLDKNNFYTSQLAFYYKESIDFARDLVSAVDSYIGNDTSKMEYDLQKVYCYNKRLVSGVQYMKDKPFTNIILEMVVIEDNKITVGDKLSNRYGGKGVVSKILPDNLMPMICKYDGTKECMEAIFNSSTCVNRLNPGQLFETSLTHIGQRIIEYVNLNIQIKK